MGLRVQITYWALDPIREGKYSEDKEAVQIVLSQTLRTEHRTKRLSEEECLLGPARNRSNIGPHNQGDLPGCINDKDVPQKRAREKKTLKNI